MTKVYVEPGHLETVLKISGATPPEVIAAIKELAIALGTEALELDPAAFQRPTQGNSWAEMFALQWVSVKAPGIRIDPISVEEMDARK